VLRFGTDGVRGQANVELRPEVVLALGRAAAKILAPQGTGCLERSGARARFLVGRDTRRSGPMLQAALTAGLASEGADVVDAGVLPTPALAYLSAREAVPAAMISASHNPFWDNGVKFFLAGGAKLGDAEQEALEAELERVVGHTHGHVGVSVQHEHRFGAAVGTATVDLKGLGHYERHVVGCLEGRALGGLKVVLDCANGAAHVCAPTIFARAGADVVAVLGCAPDGTNINDGCGSTDPAALAEAVVETGADIGLAFDGDADRVIAVDATGNPVDGDRLLALFAVDLAERGALRDMTVAVTVMTNLGFHQAMAAAGVKVHTVAVGDRYVLEALDANGWTLGGEQSGHIIFRSLATTGDGVLSGLLLADLVARRSKPLARLAGEALQRCPQVLRNVVVTRRDALAGASEVWQEIARAEHALGDRGRVLVRPSGTEPLVRVMVEASTQEEAESVAGALVEVLHLALGRPET